MKILFITLSPIDSTFSMAHRNRSLISGLVQLGHQLDIITIYPYDSTIQISDLDIFSKVNIVRVNQKPSLNGNSSILKRGGNSYLSKLFRKIYHHLFPFDSSYFLLNKIGLDILPEKQYDIIISSSDPKTSHILTKLLIKKGLKYRRWIQYWGDPLTLDITSKLIYPKWMIRILEKSILKNSDSIVYVSPITYKEQSKMFHTYSDRMKYFSIGYEKEKLYPKTNNKKFVIGYFGFYLNTVRNILPLYNAVANSTEDFELNIVGTSDIELKKSDRVFVFDNSNNIESHELKTDLIVVVLNLRGGQIPGKIFHLAATNKPVLIVLDGEYKDIIKDMLAQYNRFVFCENNEVDILTKIIEIKNKNISYSPVAELHSIQIAKKIIEMIN